MYNPFIQIEDANNKVLNLFTNTPLSELRFTYLQATSLSSKATKKELNRICPIIANFSSGNFKTLNLNKFTYCSLDARINGDSVNERIVNSVCKLITEIGDDIGYCVLHKNYTIYIHVAKVESVKKSNTYALTIIAVNNTSSSIIVHNFKIEKPNNNYDKIKLHRGSGSPYKASLSNVNECSYCDFMSHDYMLTLVAESLNVYPNHPIEDTKEIQDINDIKNTERKEYEFFTDKWFRCGHLRRYANGKIVYVRATTCHRRKDLVK